jgi:Tol biopolymer transport system component
MAMLGATASSADEGGRDRLQAAAAAKWAVAYELYDERIGEGGIGLAVVSSARRQPVVLVRRHRGSQDNFSFPEWSTDGSFIAFSAEIKGRISFEVMRADGGARRRIVDGDIVDFEWSPDGKRIAFVAGCDLYSPSDGFNGCARGRIEVVSSDGGSRHVVVRPTAGRADSSITLQGWSPDGLSLLYAVEARSRARLYSIPARGGSARLLADSVRGRLGDASWSPNGNLIAYKRNCNENRIGDVFCDLVVTDAAGVSKRVLRRQGSNSSGPSSDAPTWIPHSSFLIFSEFGNRSGVRRLDVRTGEFRTLTTDYWGDRLNVARDGRTIGNANRYGLVLARADGSRLARHKLPDGACDYSFDCELWIG